MNGVAKITLAIESAIAGGSISLLTDDTEIDSWIGSSNVSKAEDLLANIDDILASNGLTAKDLDLIAVSAGPGSFTGIRIGIATALGLKVGLGIPVASQTTLAAMANYQSISGSVVAAVPVGRNAVCLQEFNRTDGALAGVDEPHTITEDKFLELVHRDKARLFLLHQSFFEKIVSTDNITGFSDNLAFAIGRICRENAGVVTPPLFISKTS